MEKNMEQIQKINELKVYTKVLGNRVSVKLPESFYNNQDVELTVKPIRKEQRTASTDNEWKIPEF
jgi:hypothetical protein